MTDIIRICALAGISKVGRDEQTELG